MPPLRNNPSVSSIAKAFRCLCLCLAGLMMQASLFGNSGISVSEDFIASHHARMDGLFAELSDAYPEIHTAKQLWQSREYAKACETLLDYYANRPALPNDVLFGWNYKANPYHNPVYAEELAPDVTTLRFTIQGVTATQRLRADGEIDWQWRGPKNDPEWAWLLNRHAFFYILAKDWERTKDDAYPTLVSRWLSDWVINNPAPKRLSFSSSWRALEAARRITDSWPQVFEQWRHTPAFSAEARLLMLSSIPDHARVLRDHGSFWGGNHLVTEKTALAKLALVWPEFQEASAWFAYAADKIGAEILAQTYPDGSYKELTNHYQKIVLLNAQVFLVLLEYSGQLEKYDEVSDRITEMWRYFAGVALPAGYGPINNAADREHNMGLLAAIDEETPLISGITREEILEVYNEPPRTRLFPWAGQAVMRSRTGRDGLWAFFDVGPYGTAHQHDDRLHLSVAVRSTEVLTDGGRYTYQPGKWRDYFKGPRSHNIVLLDGAHSSQAPLAAKNAPLPVHQQYGAGWDYFSANAFFPHDVIGGRGRSEWRRSVLHLHDYGWLVIDDLLSYGAHEMETLWHFSPSTEAHLTPDGIRVDDAKGVTLLELTCASEPAADLSLVRGQEDPIVAGWNAPQYNMRLPAWELSAKMKLSRPTRIIWNIKTVEADGIVIPSDQSITWEKSSGDRIVFTLSAIGKPEITAE